jgi:hypothetical protein
MTNLNCTCSFYSIYSMSIYSGFSMLVLQCVVRLLSLRFTPFATPHCASAN